MGVDVWPVKAIPKSMKKFVVGCPSTPRMTKLNRAYSAEQVQLKAPYLIIAAGNALRLYRRLVSALTNPLSSDTPRSGSLLNEATTRRSHRKASTFLERQLRVTLVSVRDNLKT